MGFKHIFPTLGLSQHPHLAHRMEDPGISNQLPFAGFSRKDHLYACIFIHLFDCFGGTVKF